MVVNNEKEDNVEPHFTIENNVLKGKVVTKDTLHTGLGKLLFDVLRNNPDVIGQVDAITGIEDTFADITDRAIKCALWLRKQGVGKGDIVVICTHNHRDSTIPFLAGLFLGAIVNSWDNEMNIQYGRHMMTLTLPEVIFANEKSAALILEVAKIELFHTRIVCFGHYPGTTPFADVLKDHQESAVANFKCEEIDDLEETALLLFSSGTTGLPKAVQLPHRALINMLMTDYNMITDIIMTFSSLYWISGVLFTIKGIYSCTKRIIPPEFEPQVACELLQKYKVSWALLSTSISNRLIRYSHLRDYDLSSLKAVIIGGAILQKESEDLLRKYLPHAVIVQAYGTTELGGVITIQLPGTTSGSCGIVSANSEIKIVDVKTGRALGPNQPGELQSKTWTMSTGYYKNPEETKNTFDEDGWMHTGDLAYYNEKGEFFIIDRIKELIKYRGHQISPSEIEALLQTHPAVVEAAVVGVPHPTDDEHPIAFVCKAPNKEVSAEELIKLVEVNMMDHNRLRAGVKFLPKLPYTNSGKIARKELRAMAKKIAIG
ncbi:uncharacterized protein LOC143428154 [Xylocopa sonorina]|uniref:uncharacterized protein LOC143428154 n=1 Tax=Xylocopa sonorina TaxID=1818115 RepID=UPI00403AE907